MEQSAHGYPMTAAKKDYWYCKKHAEVSMCGTPAHQYVYVKLLIINLKPPSFVSPQTIGKHPHDTVQIKKVKQTLKKSCSHHLIYVVLVTAADR